jgi:hypothetical protein
MSLPKSDMKMVNQMGRLKLRKHTAQLYPKGTLELGEDLGIGDGFSRLVILQHGGFLIYLLSDLLLRELQFQTCCLHCLYERDRMVAKCNMSPQRVRAQMIKHTHTSDTGCYLGWRSDFILTIQFDYTLVIRALGTVSKVIQ